MGLALVHLGVRVAEVRLFLEFVAQMLLDLLLEDGVHLLLIDREGFEVVRRAVPRRLQVTRYNLPATS